MAEQLTNFEKELLQELSRNSGDPQTIITIRNHIRLGEPSVEFWQIIENSMEK